MEIKCQRCGNLWDYSGDKIKEIKKYPQFVSCPKCRTSVKLEEINETKMKIKNEIKSQK